MTFEEKIRAFLNDENYEPMTKEDLSFAMGISTEDLRPFFEMLVKMERRGSIILSKKKKSTFPKRIPTIRRGNSCAPREAGHLSPERIRISIFLPKI